MAHRVGSVLIVFVLTGLTASVTLSLSRQYTFVDTRQTWTEAQRVCRSGYTDLATIETAADVDAVVNTTLTSNYTGKAWIGLYDDLVDSWTWSYNESSYYAEGEATFRNWLEGQPSNVGGQQYCVELFSGIPFFGGWADQECSSSLYFTCFNGTVNGTASFLLIERELNWTEAQTYCRENYVDLASIRNQRENDAVAELAAGQVVWIGLSREKSWSDGSSSLFRNWASTQPDSGDEQCVATSLSESGLWSDENCSLSLPLICYTTILANADGLKVTGQNETSVSLKWDKVDDNVSFIFLFNGIKAIIRAPDGDGPVNYTVSSLTAATRYTFTVLSVFENVRSSGVSITAVTAPPNTASFRSVGQSETSVSLQWDKVGDNVNFILLFNGTEIKIRAPDGDGPVNYTVSSLTAATRYMFTVFSVFHNVKSSGVSITAVTAPPNTASFTSVGQNETSVSLQWDKVDDNFSFVLLFNGTETNISAPDGDGPVVHIVSPLTAATRYTFTVFSVFENVRSSGVSITAVTAPLNTASFTSVGQSETRVFLQWDKVGDNVSYVLRFSGTEIKIGALDRDGPLFRTVSSLTAATRYTFTMFSVFENVRSSGVSITAVTAPPNTASFLSVRRNETSVSLQWDKVDDNVSFVFLFNGTETNISAPDGDGPVVHIVSPLTAATRYTFTVVSVFENVRSSGVSITAVTAPARIVRILSVGQNETSISLQWDKVDGNVSYVLLFSGTEIEIRAPDGDGPVNYTVSSLTAATRYMFTVFSVFENVSSRSAMIRAATAPPNTASLRSVGQNETSVSLQWDKVDDIVNYILYFNGMEIKIRAPDGDGPVNYTVSPLTPSMKYTFTVFSVFENIRSSGVSITAVTDGPQTVLGFNIKLTSPVELSESEVLDAIEELLRTYGLSSQVLALKVHSTEVSLR